MPKPHLAIADADRIHEYVFSPHELKLIRGGSALQVKLNRETLKDLVRDLDGECITANGGTVLAAFQDKPPAEEYCRRAERSFLNATHVATVTTMSGPYSEATFGEDRRSLLAGLERKKQCRTAARFNAGGAYVASCGACGLYPAVTYDDREGKALCRACVIRQEHSQRDASAPKDFNELGLGSKPQGYLAIVYIDLDGLGEFLNRYGTNKEACRKLSVQIDESVKGAAEEACKRLPKTGEKDQFEILIAGGDDAVVALPAHLVFQFLETFSKLYGAVPLWADDSTTFSAGIVIAHSHFPIGEFVRIAEELLRSAKSKRKVNAVHYAVLTESMADRIVSGDTDAPGRVSVNPYEMEEFFKLVCGIRDLKRLGAPHSQIHSLYGIAHEGPMQSELDYLYLLTRLDRAHADILRQPYMIGPRLFHESTTRAADIVELWDFIHAE